MTDISSAPEHDLPTPTEKPGRSLSIVWLIPLIAAAIAAWLAYAAVSNKGPTITITFESAEGLEAGKTKVKYKDVDVGLVTEVALAEDLSHILVTAEMAKGTSPHVNERTRFWIVRPRIGTGGISGLSTLVSGAYVEVDPGGGEAETEFVGLEEPPLIDSDIAGREFVLHTDTLSSISRGSPIQFRGLDVGEILGYELDDDSQGVSLHAFIQEPYDQLVTERTRFWNTSGINLDLSADGINASTGSLQSLLIGGIAFDTPLTSSADQPAETGAEFPLYANFKNLAEAAFVKTVPYLVHFDGSVRGLRVNAPVEFRGMKVGRVADVRLVYDARRGSLEIPVVIELEPERVAIEGGDETATDAPDDYAVMAELVEKGLRAQLASGNLLTGELLVALDIKKYRPKAALDFDQVYPEIPSIPSDLEDLTRSVSDVVGEISGLPLQEIATDLRQLLQSTDALVSSPEAIGSLESLDAALVDIQALTAKLDGQTGPLLDAFLAALRNADLTLDQTRSTLAATEGLVSENSKMNRGLNGALAEISSAARSIRIFADYLERHPEALLRGK
ncbi:MAG: intermembrane transport protein PqiB [Geminicoccaceae bacterium]